MSIDEAVACVRALDAGAPIVVGTLALALRGAPVAFADIDVVIDVAHLDAVASVLVARGFRLTSWGEEVSVPLHVPGRFYLRALAREGLDVDVTYEGFDRAALHASTSWVRGVRVAGAPYVLATKRARGAPRDLEILEALRGWSVDERGG
jgi:hypothetical protein